MGFSGLPGTPVCCPVSILVKGCSEWWEIGLEKRSSTCVHDSGLLPRGDVKQGIHMVLSRPGEHQAFLPSNRMATQSRWTQRHSFVIGVKIRLVIMWLSSMD